MKIYINLILIFLYSCSTPTTYFDKKENMFLYVNQTKENIHRPIKLESTKNWITKADNIGLYQFNISVNGTYLSFEINGKNYFFDENWINKKKKTAETSKRIEKVATNLGITNDKAEELITEFFDLGLNRYLKEKEYSTFVNESWLTFSKGYLYFLKEYNIKVNDTINIKNLTGGNYQAGRWNNYIIKNKIDKNWFEWYRPTGLKDTLN